MGEDDLNNLSKTITGDDDDDEMDERLNDAAVHMKDRDGGEMTPGELIEALGDEDDERSADAADELERLVEEDPEELEGHEEALLEALETDDSWARRAAMAALAEVGSKKSLRKLEDIDLPEAEEAAAEIRERRGIDREVNEEVHEEGREGTKDEEHGLEHEETEEEEHEAEPETGAEAETTAGGRAGGSSASASTSTSTSTTDGGTKTETKSSAASTGQGRALDAAKNGDVDVDFSEIVVLQMLESEKEEPNIYAEESLRYAIREYPDMATDMADDVADRLTDGRDDVRRYASVVMHEVSKEYTDKAREYIPEIVESLSDDDEISQRGEEALTNIAQEHPEDVVGNVAELSKD